MKTTMKLLNFVSFSLILVACSGNKQSDSEKRWSKPQQILEGCEGVRSNSQQCQNNPNSQQLMIKIDRK